jgi:hypothetical protein
MTINKKNFSFCVITDKKYLAQTIILLDQLKSYNVYVLCVDNESYFFLDKTISSNIKIVRLNIIEKFFNLKKIKYNRTYVEYIFTLKSFFIKWILAQIKKNYHVIYLDSDILFFSKPELLIKEIDSQSVCLTPHRFSKNNSHLNIYGKFNAGFISFKNDNFGLKALHWWMSSCKKECSLKKQDNFADQKYLNYLYQNYKKVKKINNICFNLAPWNLDSCKITLNRKSQILVNKKRLVFFHFHGFKNIFGIVYSLGFGDYKILKNQILINSIYKPYINFINTKIKIHKELKSYYFNYNIKKLVKSLIKFDFFINLN